jgi:hypothetical protein
MVFKQLRAVPVLEHHNIFYLATSGGQILINISDPFPLSKVLKLDIYGKLRWLIFQIRVSSALFFVSSAKLFFLVTRERCPTLRMTALSQEQEPVKIFSPASLKTGHRKLFLFWWKFYKTLLFVTDVAVKIS